MQQRRQQRVANHCTIEIVGVSLPKALGVALYPTAIPGMGAPSLANQGYERQKSDLRRVGRGGESQPEFLARRQWRGVGDIAGIEIRQDAHALLFLLLQLLFGYVVLRFVWGCGLVCRRIRSWLPSLL